MPRKLYPSGEGADRRRYVTTGARRPVKAGELYLSGAVPAVYVARADIEDARDIMREATPEEGECVTCGQRLPNADAETGRPEDGCDNAGNGREHYALAWRVLVSVNPFVDRANGEYETGTARLCTKCCDHAKACGYIVRNA